MRESNLSPRAAVPLAVAILALAAAGCGRAPAPIAPASEPTPAHSTGAGSTAADGRVESSASGFYPLSIGNEWSYDHALSIVVIPIGGPPDPVILQTDRRTRDIVCNENVGGNDYFVERTYYPSPPDFTWIRLREDRDGLFEADIATTQPPTCSAAAGRPRFDGGAVAPRSDEEAWAAIAARVPASARAAYREAWDGIEARASAIRRVLRTGPARPRTEGVGAGEITRLEYPLHPGASWVIREDPRFESTVEGAEALDLAVGHIPAWRIRIDIDGLGARDRVHVWYSRSGFLKSDVHLEAEATDTNGNPIGLAILEESEELVALSLNRGRFAAP
jgi:hypothetical protein